MQPNVTVLPYIPPADDDTRHFDAYQLNRPVKMISAETQIASSDAKACHVERRFQRHYWIPPFANNTPQLRRVIAERVWEYSCQGRGGSKKGNKKPIPAELVNDADKLRALADEHFERQWVLNRHRDRPERAEHIRAVVRAGGYLQFITAIAYRSFNLGMTSPEIAAEMGIKKPTTVRIQVCRLRDTAKSFGFELGRISKSSKGGERHLKQWKKKTRPNVVKIKRTPTGIRMRLVHRNKAVSHRPGK